MGSGRSHREGHTVTELIYRLGLVLGVCALFELHPDAEQDTDRATSHSLAADRATRRQFRSPLPQKRQYGSEEGFPRPERKVQCRIGKCRRRLDY